VWTAPLLATSVLLVLSAFFVTAAVAALVRIKSALLAALAALLATLLTALLAALLTARRTIVLRITARRMLAATFAGSLLHTLIAISVVCHNNPPLFVC
jgi:hypothetical protein